MSIKTETKKRRGRAIKSYSAQEREDHLRAWESSGQSGTAYAREHGLGENLLYSWRSKRNKAKGSNASRSNSLSLLPVSIVESPKPEATTAAKLSCLSMRFNGVEVYVSGLANEDIAVVASQIHKEVFNV